MAFVSPLTRVQIAELIAQEYAAEANIPADTSEGSAIGSVFNAKALAAMALQTQVIYVADIARLNTIGPNPTNSAIPNPDVDSFCAPFGVIRLEAQASTGQVTFSCSFAPSANILIPAVPLNSTSGVIVQTPSGVQFVVVQDTTNMAYNATLNGYVITAGTTSVNATVQCLSAGTSGNVAAGQISQIFSGPGVTSIAGVAYVTNAAAFTNASALETDAAMKVRFANAMTASPYATNTALAAAVGGVALGLTFSIGDNVNSTGAPAPGNVTVVVNYAGMNASPPSSLLTQVSAAVTTARTLGITHTVIAPTLVPVNMTCTVKVAPGYLSTAVSAACSAAYTTLVNNIGLDPQGANTSAKIAAVYATLYTTPGVLDVQALTLNSGSVDVIGTFGQQLVAGTTAVATI